jgi:hypothetical protein
MATVQPRPRTLRPLRADDWLDLDTCPFCRSDRPSLRQVADTSGDLALQSGYWAWYRCSRCQGHVTVEAERYQGTVLRVIPSAEVRVPGYMPERAAEFLRQSLVSTQAPAGVILLAASAIDEMLKAKGLVDGSLYARIKKAAETHLITPDMGTWAHHVRLEANDQRHADVNAGLPTTEEAAQCIEFARALATFMFTLPARVTRGIQDSRHQQKGSDRGEGR